MEGLADFLPFILVALYYLLRRKDKAGPEKAGPPAPDRAPTPFEDLVRRLEEAAGQPTSGPPLPTPTPIEAAPVPKTRVSTSRLEEFRAPAGSFDSDTSVDHQAHGFGDANPFSEERFERALPGSRPPSKEARSAYDPHGLQSSGAAPPAARPDWPARLRQPTAARDAFVLKTIFERRTRTRRR